MQIEDLQSEEELEQEKILHRLKTFGGRLAPGTSYHLTKENVLEEAKMGGAFEYSRMLHALEIPGKLPEKEQELQMRIKAFFWDSIKVDLTGYFAPRHEPDYSSCTVLSDSIHLHGVDFMSTSRLIRYFGIYEPFKLEWINESSCNAIFQSPARARRTFQVNLRAQLPGVEQPETFLIQDDTDPLLLNAVINEREWYQFKPYHELGFERRIMARFATSEDVVDPFVPRKKQFSQYLATKKYFTRTKAAIEETIQQKRRRKQILMRSTRRRSSRQRRNEQKEEKRHEKKETQKWVERVVIIDSD